MRKNKLIALIGTLTMAAAGLAAVSAGVSSKKADSVSAGTQKTMYVEFNGISGKDSCALYENGHYNWPGKMLSTVAGYSEISMIYGSRTQTKTFYSFNIDTSYTEIALTHSNGTDYWDNKWDISDARSSAWNAVQYKGWGDPGSYNAQHMHKITIIDGSTTTYEYNCAEWGSYYLPTHSDTSKTFIGWYVNGDTTTTKLNDGGKYDLSTSNIDDITFEAVYQEVATTYTINFAAGTGGTGSMTPVTPKAGEDYTLPTRVDKIYKNKAHFDYWSDGLGHNYEDCATIPANTYSVDQNVTLTANYREYDVADGFYVEFFDVVRNPQRVKLEWNGQSGYTSSYDATIAMNAGDKFKVVQYEDDKIIDGHYYGTEMVKMEEGAAILLGQFYKESETSSNIVTRVSGTYNVYFNDQYETDKIWIPANSYTVVYDNNGGSGTVGNQTAYYYDDSTETGRSFAKNVYGKTTFTAPDSTKIFDGWSTNKNATHGDLKPGDMQATADKVPNPTSGNSVTLYAIWRDKNPADGYYVKIFTDGHQANIPMGLKDGSTTEYVVNVDLAKNDEFKVVYYQDEVINESTGYHGYTELKSGDGSAKDSNELTGTDNIVASKAGNYEIYYETGSVNPGIWAPNLIDVTFNANGHGTAPQGVTVRNGNAISDPGDLSEDGWTFTGWFEDQACQNEWDFATNLAFDTNHNANYTVDSANNTCTKTLYAGWEEESHDVTVTIQSNNTDYGTVSLGSVTVPSGTEIETHENELIFGDKLYVVTATETDPTKTKKYSFDYWDNVPLTVESNITITAVFSESTRTYDILLNYCDGVHGQGVIKDLQYNDSLVNKVGGGVPKWEDHVFEGFYTQEGGLGTKYYDKDLTALVTNYTDTSVNNLYAYWTIAEYQITFNLNAPTGKTVSPSSITPVSIKNGDTIPTLTEPSCTGYTFKGWYVTVQGVEYAISEYTTYPLHSGCELVAHWDEIVPEVEVTVNNSDYGSVERMSGESSLTFNIPYGTEVTIDENVLAFGEEEILTAVPKEYSEDYLYLFSSWSNISDGDVITDDIEITANFVRYANPVITIGSCEGGSIVIGSDPVSSLVVPYGSTVEIIDDIIEITYEDLDFDVMLGALPTSDEQYNRAFEEWDGINEGTITSSTILTATFSKEPVPYTISYETNGGTLKSGMPSSYNYESGVITLPVAGDFTNIPNHSSFGGWFDNEDCEGTAIKTIPAQSTGNKTFYAKWIAEEKVTISYYADSVLVRTDEGYAGETAPAAPTVPAKAGYSGSWDSSYDTFPSSNATVTAVYNKETYAISLNQDGGTGGSLSKTSYQISDSAQTVTITDSIKVGQTPTYSLASAPDGVTISGNTITISANTTGNIEVTTSWTKNTYTVTLDPGDGEGGSVSPTTFQVSNVAQTITITDPVKDGYAPSYSVSGVDGATVSNNVVTIPADAVGNLVITTSWTITPEGEAKQFAQEFVKTINETDGLCKISGYDDKGNPIYDVNMTQLQTFWKNHSDAFKSLSEGAQGYLKDASPDMSEEASALSKFAWSYQYVYTKYGKNFADYGGDFLEKGYTPNSSRLVSVNDISTSTWIIASVAIVGIAAVGVFFIYRKRKEN